MKKLAGKVVIITGAGMGLGLATAIEAAKEGASLMLVDYNGEKLAEAIEAIKKVATEVKVISFVADVSDESKVKEYVAKTLEAFGTIHGFYNNAGIEGRQAPLDSYDLDVFKKVIDINLMGVYYGLRYILPIMQKNNYGRVVNVASVGGLRGVMNQTPYVASKHAVSGITKNVALEYGRYGITANAIAPGAILTPMVAEAFRQINPNDPKVAETEYAKANPTKRLGIPEEVAKVVVFLLSDDASYVSGQTIAIDGGQSEVYGNV